MDPLNYNLTELFVHLVCDSLYQYTYDAELVGLEWSLINSQYGITVRTNINNNSNKILYII